MIDWSMEPIFGYGTSLLLGAVLLLGLILLREDRPISRGRLIGLWALRLLIVLVVMLGVLRPGLTFTSRSAPKGAIAVMMDLSASMDLAGANGPENRFQEEKKIWAQLKEAQERIGKDNPLILYGYDNQLRSLTGDAAIPASPIGASTDVGKTLSQLTSSQVDPPLSAVVWMGDASQTVTPSSVDPQQVARQLAQLDVPIFLFGLGPRGDSGKLKDISVESVPEQISIYSSTETAVMGLVRVRGMSHREIQVQLWMRAKGEEPKMIAQEAVTPDQSDQSMPFRLPLIAPDAGSYELEVRVPLEDGELLKENNQALCYLNVQKGGRRVLYIFGEPEFEQKFVRTALGEYKELKVDFTWIQRKNSKTWPIDLTKQLNSGEFDAYVLGDVDSSAISKESWELLAKRIEEGAGLVTMGGFQTYGPGGYAETKLADILPVEIDSRFRQDLGAPINAAAHIPGEIRLRPRSNTPGEVTQLTDTEKNLQLWMNLKPMQGANRWNGVKKLPGLQLLLESDKGEPMMVRSEVGNGKVISIAFNTTYQWCFQGNTAEHRRFWRQVILSVMRSSTMEEGFDIRLSKRRFFRSESMEAVIEWNPGSDNASMPEAIEAQVWDGSKSIGTIVLQKSGDRTMTGKINAPDKGGRYEIRCTAISGSGKIESQLPFIVMDQSIESQNPIPDWALLEQMARMNESAGGTLLTASQVDTAIEKLIDRKNSATVELVESHRLGDSTIDSWIYFAILVGLLTLQWQIRKRWNLV